MGSFSFHRGPIFTNVLLADEINRASPRTQSALLEAMSEAQVTVDGDDATRSPRRSSSSRRRTRTSSPGTYPLPEAQLDRFLVCVAIGYPSEDEELSMLYARQREEPLDRLSALATREDLTAIQAAVQNVEVKPAVGRYLLSVVAATRGHKDVVLGRESPRRARALPCGPGARVPERPPYVSPDDVQSVARPSSRIASS